MAQTYAEVRHAIYYGYPDFFARQHAIRHFAVAAPPPPQPRLLRSSTFTPYHGHHAATSPFQRTDSRRAGRWRSSASLPPRHGTSPAPPRPPTASSQSPVHITRQLVSFALHFSCRDARCTRRCPSAADRRLRLQRYERECIHLLLFFSRDAAATPRCRAARSAPPRWPAPLARFSLRALTSTLLRSNALREVCPRAFDAGERHNATRLTPISVMPVTSFRQSVRSQFRPADRR